MTERINVAAKTTLNRVRAVIALIFWIIIGIFAYFWLNDGYYYDFAWLGIVGGIVIGVIRLFIINDKYAWQVATIEEIRDLKKLLEKNEIVINTTESLNSEESKQEEKEKIHEDYEIIEKDGKKFAVIKNGNPDNFYCPYCYTQINPKSDTCRNCNKKL